MARKVFFSFHYERDAWRAGQVRNCNLLPSEDSIGFIDGVDWESLKKQGDKAVERWIQSQLNGTTVTVVLIGTETADREWVQYEINESWNRGNGLIGIWIHNVKDRDKLTDVQGLNPFDQFKLPDGRLLSAVCQTHDWVLEDGRNNLGSWVDGAIDIRAEAEEAGEVSPLERLKETPSLVGSIAVAAGAVAIATIAARAFKPRAPWCPMDDN